MNYIYNNKEEENKLLDRFCRYVKIWSESDGKAADAGVFPSTERQWDIAKVLVKELRNLGTRNVYLTDNCYVVAKIDSNITDSEERKKYPAILLMAHMEPTKQDDTIVKSDGTTLLGADDKAGVSAIMAAVEYLMNHYEEEGLKHGPIEVMFSPDEETGHGMDKVPLNILKADFAVTVDGGDEGELEAECFNAWAASLKFTGKACHTGSAKAGGMVNAVTLASTFVSELPRNMAPETTENYEGFIAPMEITGSIESASVDMLLRSFNIEEIEKEKEIIKTAAESVVSKLGGTYELNFKQQYLNMKEKLNQHPEILTRLEKAYEDSGVKVRKQPIRGGTDGSRLTELGIPTPNIFTGAHEFHSRNEWLSLNQCAKAADVLINLLTQKVE